MLRTFAKATHCFDLAPRRLTIPRALLRPFLVRFFHPLSLSPSASFVTTSKLYVYFSPMLASRLCGSRPAVYYPVPTLGRVCSATNACAEGNPRSGRAQEHCQFTPASAGAVGVPRKNPTALHAAISRPTQNAKGETIRRPARVTSCGRQSWASSTGDVCLRLNAHWRKWHRFLLHPINPHPYSRP